MDRTLTCYKCGKVGVVDADKIFDTMDHPDRRRDKGQWEIRWLEDIGPKPFCPDEA